MKELQVLTQEFNGVKVGFRIGENGQSEVRIDEVAKFCGWTKTAESGNEVINWTRLRKYLSELGMVQKCTSGDFIPEYIMYPLIGKANNEKATQFMLWVGKTLVDLRIKGVVIMEHAKKETIDFEIKFGKYRIRKTFVKSENVVEDYKQFIELSKAEWKSKRLNNADRVKLSNIVVSALKYRISNNVLVMKASEILMLQELISDVKTDVIKLSNKKNGGEKGVQTKAIKKLQEQIEHKNTPRSSEFVTIGCHPFSINYMYQTIGNRTFKTPAYMSWIANFPEIEVPELDYWDNVDFTKPIELFVNYVAKESFDQNNCDKATIDQIFNRMYGIDDNIIYYTHSQKVGTVKTYADGSISFFIRNIIEQE